MNTILISIRKRHLKNMMKGKKTWELRRTRPRIDPPFRVLCCVVGTGGSVEAAWICDRVACLSGADAKHIARLACLTPEEVREYKREGTLFGWHVQEGTLWDWKGLGIARHVTDYGIRRPPQSWRYVEAED